MDWERLAHVGAGGHVEHDHKVAHAAMAAHDDGMMSSLLRLTEAMASFGADADAADRWQHQTDESSSSWSVPALHAQKTGAASPLV